MHVQRRTPAVDRRAPGLDGIEEFRQHRTVRVIRERHRISTAAPATGLTCGLHRAIVKMRAHFPVHQTRGTVGAGQLHRFAETGIARGRRGERADATVAKAQRCGHRVLGFHLVYCRGVGIGHHLGNAAGQIEKQIKLMDCLGHQDAAAIARQGATARHIVVGLRTPPWH